MFNCFIVVFFSRAFPGIFGNQAERLAQVIHQIFLNCLIDQETKVRYTGATALAAYLKHNAENPQFLNVYRDCLTPFIAVRFLRLKFELKKKKKNSFLIFRR